MMLGSARCTVWSRAQTSRAENPWRIFISPIGTQKLFRWMDQTDMRR